MSLLLYAVTDDLHPGPRDARGIHGRPLRLVCSRGLAAVVEGLPARPAVSVSALEAFAAVTGGLAELGTILPARFGTMVADESAAEAALEQQAEVLHRCLARVRDAVEYGLRALTDATSRAAEDATGARERPVGPGAGTAYLMGRVASDRRRQEVLARITSAVGDLSRAYRERPDHPHGVTVACLVDRRDTGSFLTAVQRLRCELAPDAQLVWTGPWAPFSFSTETGS
jgi:hypothetical protein